MRYPTLSVLSVSSSVRGVLADKSIVRSWEVSVYVYKRVSLGFFLHPPATALVGLCISFSLALVVGQTNFFFFLWPQSNQFHSSIPLLDHDNYTDQHNSFVRLYFVRCIDHDSIVFSTVDGKSPSRYFSRDCQYGLCRSGIAWRSNAVQQQQPRTRRAIDC